MYGEYSKKKFKNAKKGFTVVSVSLDKTKEAWIGAIQADGLIWPNHMSDLGRSFVAGQLAHMRELTLLSATADGRTLYRDQLRFSAGPLTLLVWPVLWAFWQWRGRRIRSLARDWR